jgi:hypothetical protein
MSEQFIPHPPSPNPEKKDTVTFNKKNLAIAFLAVAIAILAIVLIVPGDKDSTPVTTNPPASAETNVTMAPAPVTNKYDDYMNHVLNNSGQANSWGKAKLIEFGDLVCQALDEGNSVGQVANLLSSYAKTTSDMQMFAAVMYGAIKHICPQYMPDLNYYLNS